MKEKVICIIVQISVFLSMLAACVYWISEKDSIFFRRMSVVLMLVAVFGYAISCWLGSGAKGTSVMLILSAFVLFGGAAYGTYKGYASGEVKDYGTNTFTAVKYWQDKYTTTIRHRTKVNYSNFVKYTAKLPNGEVVEYKHSTSTMGEAIGLVENSAQKERQVFLFNEEYYIDEAGVSADAFLKKFVRWRNGFLILGLIYLGIGGLLAIWNSILHQWKD